MMKDQVQQNVCNYVSFENAFAEGSEVVEHALETSNESSVKSSWDKPTQDVIMVQETPLLNTNAQEPPSTLHPEEEEEKQSNPNEVTSMDDEIDSHHMKVDLFLRKLLANADHNAACERNKADKPFKAVSAINESRRATIDITSRRRRKKVKPR